LQTAQAKQRERPQGPFLRKNKKGKDRRKKEGGARCANGGGGGSFEEQSEPDGRPKDPDLHWPMKRVDRLGEEKTGRVGNEDGERTEAGGEKRDKAQGDG